MRLVKVRPVCFEKRGAFTNLRSQVEYQTRSGRWTSAVWYSAPDVTVAQLCEEVRRRWEAEQVDFQAPLFGLYTLEYHAGDYLSD